VVTEDECLELVDEYYREGFDTLAEMHLHTWRNLWRQYKWLHVAPPPEFDLGGEA